MNSTSSLPVNLILLRLQDKLLPCALTSWWGKIGWDERRKTNCWYALTPDPIYHDFHEGIAKHLKLCKRTSTWWLNTSDVQISSFFEIDFDGGFVVEQMDDGVNCTHVEVGLSVVRLRQTILPGEINSELGRESLGWLHPMRRVNFTYSFERF